MKFYVLIFCLVLVADVLALWLGYPTIHTWVKPLLMPILLLFVWRGSSVVSKKINWLLIAGLIFAWAGDIFLLFENNYPLFFMAGLGCFLGTHIFYILMFLQIRGSFSGPHRKLWVIWLSITVYGLILLFILWPNLNNMKIPVLIYAICICVMAILSVQTTQMVALPTRKWLIGGALLFVLSDSILALNKFSGAKEWAPPAIMLTYGLAQLAIAVGASNLSKAVYDEGVVPVV